MELQTSGATCRSVLQAAVLHVAEAAADKRETARRKRMRRAVLISSRGNQTRLELFGSEFDGWPAKLAESMLEAV